MGRGHGEPATLLQQSWYALYSACTENWQRSAAFVVNLNQYVRRIGAARGGVVIHSIGTAFVATTVERYLLGELHTATPTKLL